MYNPSTSVHYLAFIALVLTLVFSSMLNIRQALYDEQEIER